MHFIKTIIIITGGDDWVETTFLVTNASDAINVETFLSKGSSFVKTHYFDPSSLDNFVWRNAKDILFPEPFDKKTVAVNSDSNKTLVYMFKPYVVPADRQAGREGGTAIVISCAARTNVFHAPCVKKALKSIMIPITFIILVIVLPVTKNTKNGNRHHNHNKFERVSVESKF